MVAQLNMNVRCVMAKELSTLTNKSFLSLLWDFDELSESFFYA